MFPIRPGQYRHLKPKYQKVIPPDLTSGLKASSDPKVYSNARLNYIEAGLEPFSGELTDAHLVHFIKRTRFGATLEELKRLRGKSLNFIVSESLASFTPFTEPVNNYNDVSENKIDPEVPLGQSFVQAAFNRDFEGDRIVALKSWMIGSVLGPNSGIQEKMVLLSHPIPNNTRILYCGTTICITYPWSWRISSTCS